MKIPSFLAAIFICGFIFLSASYTEAYVNVKGYYRKDGTYVQPHVRSNPNGVKYDNYGYQPSQGLYNDSYGTRGAVWDTPTDVTDPTYYQGKALYEGGQPGSTSGTPIIRKINTSKSHTPCSRGRRSAS